MLAEAGFEYTARSSALSPFQGLLRRSQTCSTDAYLGPVITDYLANVGRGLSRESSTLHVMTSAGGLVDADGYRSMDSLLSGPAGGVVGAAMTGRQAGAERVIAFDMGGTSTDVSRYDGDFEYVFSHKVGPVDLAVPALAIETVAAGGGSICRVEQGRLAVGPQSAGAHPGPASYGAGGPLTLTDVNLLLGRLVPERFPIPIDVDAARERLSELRRELDSTAEEEEILEGLLGSPTREWRRRFATSRSEKGSTRPVTVLSPLAEQAASTPAALRAFSVWRRSFCRETRVCSVPWGSGTRSSSDSPTGRS